MKNTDMYVVTMISNSARFKSRYLLYNKFAEMMKDSGATLITIELAIGDRPFAITERDNIHHIQLRTIDELWHKENALNIAIAYVAQLDPSAKYIAWIDADVLPMRPVREWIEETIHQLQIYQFVQMFETAIDLGPDHQIIGEPQIGFMARYIQGGCKPPNHNGFWKDYYSKGSGHPGYAHAANISALSAVGGLIDYSILGASDRMQCLGLVGAMEQAFDTRSKAYVQKLLEWQKRCDRWIKKDVGYVSGSIFHFWHGSKKDRGYQSRWKILDSNDYDPSTDIKYDHQGLLQLETHDERQIRLRDQIRAYFRQRNEDDIRVD